MVDRIWPLELRNVGMRKRGTDILNGINLKLQGTGITILMGPNGAGKTNLLRAMHGLERLSEGTLDWAVPETDSRKSQAFVFQTPILLRRTVQQNLDYCASQAGLGKDQAKSSTTIFAEQAQLQDKLDHPARRLSGGEQQKLALACALIRQPQALFLDEPTSNLDGRATREIESILQKAAEAGIGIVMATHDIAQARRLGSAYVFLQSGRITDQGLITGGKIQSNFAPCLAFQNGEIVE